MDWDFSFCVAFSSLSFPEENTRKNEFFIIKQIHLKITALAVSALVAYGKEIHVSSKLNKIVIKY